MAYVVFAPLAVLAAAIFGVTFTMTSRHYRALPVEVPDHFDAYGEADEMGPRPMIYAMSVAQAIVLLIWAMLVRNTIREPDALRFVVVSGIIANSMLAAFSLLQSQILGVAQGRLKRMPHQYRPLLLIAFGVAVAFALGALLR